MERVLRIVLQDCSLQVSRKDFIKETQIIPKIRTEYKPKKVRSLKCTFCEGPIKGSAYVFSNIAQSKEDFLFCSRKCRDEYIWRLQDDQKW